MRFAPFPDLDAGRNALFMAGGAVDPDGYEKHQTGDQKQQARDDAGDVLGLERAPEKGQRREGEEEPAREIIIPDGAGAHAGPIRHRGWRR